MVLGDTMSMLLKLKVDVSELSKLGVAQSAIEQFENGTIDSMEMVETKTSNAITELQAAERQMGLTGKQAMVTGFEQELLADKIDDVGDESVATGFQAQAAFDRIARKAMQANAAIRAMTPSVQTLRIAFLNLMFSAANAAFLFGGILALSPRVRAGLNLIVQGLRLIAIEAGEKLFPHLKRLAKQIRNLDEDQRDLLATISLVGTGLSLVGIVVGVLGGALISLVKPIAKVINVLGIKRLALFLAKGALMGLARMSKKVGMVIASRLIPSMTAATVSVGAFNISLLVVIGIIGLLVLAFIEFESVREIAAEGLAGLARIVLDTAAFLSFMGETLLNFGRAALNATEVGVMELARGLQEFTNDIVRDSISAINDLIEVINELASKDSTGLIPTFEKLDNTEFTDESQFDQAIEANRKALTGNLKDQLSTNRRFAEQAKENREIQKEVESGLKDLFQTDKNITLKDDALNLLDKANILTESGKKGKKANSGTGIEFNDLPSDAKQKVVNNVTIRDAEIKDDRDIREIAERINEFNEREQRRNKSGV
jgi:hypothetical protein